MSNNTPDKLQVPILRFLLMALFIVGTVAGILWFDREPGFEPFVTTLTMIAGLLATLQMGKETNG